MKIYQAVVNIKDSGIIDFPVPYDATDGLLFYTGTDPNKVRKEAYDCFRAMYYSLVRGQEEEGWKMISDPPVFDENFLRRYYDWSTDVGEYYAYHRETIFYENALNVTECITLIMHEFEIEE